MFPFSFFCGIGLSENYDRQGFVLDRLLLQRTRSVTFLILTVPISPRHLTTAAEYRKAKRQKGHAKKGGWLFGIDQPTAGVSLFTLTVERSALCAR